MLEEENSKLQQENIYSYSRLESAMSEIQQQKEEVEERTSLTEKRMSTQDCGLITEQRG